MDQHWDYQITNLPTEDTPEREWLESVHLELARLGDEGWEVVLVLKREERYVHLLLKRPKAEEADDEDGPRARLSASTRGGRPVVGKSVRTGGRADFRPGGGAGRR